MTDVTMADDAEAPAAKAKKVKTVRMKRDPEFYEAPNEADVHPDEVENWKMQNWVEA